MSSKFVLPDGVKSRDFKIPDGVKKQTSFGENVYRTLVGAARDTSQATMELGYDVYEYATGEEFTAEQKEWLPEIPDPRRYTDKEREKLYLEFRKKED